MKISGLIFAAALLAVVGCSGEGFTAAGTPAQDSGDGQVGGELLSLTTSSFRVVQVGDFWKYNERRTGFENGQFFVLVGTVTSSILSDTITDAVGNQARITSISTNLVRQEDQFPVTSMAQLYHSQDSDGTLYVHGFLDDSVQPPVSRFVKVPSEGKAIIWASPMNLGAVAQTNFIEYEDGSRETVAAVAVALEEITVAAGTFVALRVEGSGSRTTGTTTFTSAFTSWVVPELAASVRYEITISIREGGLAPHTSFTVSGELAETNVPHAGS